MDKRFQRALDLMLRRRTFLTLAAGAAAAPWLPLSAAAQREPKRGGVLKVSCGLYHTCALMTGQPAARKRLFSRAM